MKLLIIKISDPSMNFIEMMMGILVARTLLVIKKNHYNHGKNVNDLNNKGITRFQILYNHNEGNDKTYNNHEYNRFYYEALEGHKYNRIRNYDDYTNDSNDQENIFGGIDCDENISDHKITIIPNTMDWVMKMMIQLMMITLVQ